MKKQNLKSLKLSKNTISSFQELIGGKEQSGGLGCLPPPPPPVTQPYAGCNDTKNNWCDSRFGGCDSYYCPN
jgi:hypothetical protein